VLTGTENNRRKRQMNRRIRELLAVRRSLAANPIPPEESATTLEASA